MYKLLVIVDAQNDFITGVLGTQEANAAVPNIINLIKDNKWDDIICTMDTHQDNYLNTLEGEKLPVKHCIDTEPGWCMDSRILITLGNKYSFYKKDTFGSASLVNELYDIFGEMQRDIEIHICGFCTDICVMANALIMRAFRPNQKIKCHKDWCAGTSVAAHEAALEVMKSCQIEVV